MTDLDTLRKTIDECDIDIVKAIEKRFTTVKEVVQFKRDNNLEIYQPNREKEVLEKVVSHLDNKGFSGEIESLYRLIMEISKEIQKRQ